MAVKVPSKSSKPSRASDEEVEEIIESVTEGVTEEQAELVQFALTEDIEPAPRVGKIDLVREYGFAKLEKGVVKIPRLVAEVLADKGRGQIVG